jgi:hypothetical protein
MAQDPDGKDHEQCGPEFCTGCGGRRVYHLEFDKPGDHEDSLALH